jgi:Tfp pilus assembly protein PilN
MRAVNLLPRDIAPERPSYTQMLPYVGACAVPLIAASLILTGYSRAHADATAQLGKVNALQLEVERAKPVAATKTVDTSALVSSRAARRAALADALAKEMPWDRTLGDVARVLPTSVWLSDLTATSPTPGDSTVPVAPTPAPTTGPAAGPSGFSINGYTYSMDDVALLLQRLQLLPTLSNVTLSSTSGSMIGLKPVVQFSISATIVPPVTAATALAAAAAAAATATTTTTTTTGAAP